MPTPFRSKRSCPEMKSVGRLPGIGLSGWLVITVWVSPVAAIGQTPVGTGPGGAAAVALPAEFAEQSTVETLRVVHEAIEENARLRAGLRMELAQSVDEDRRTQIERELAALKIQGEEFVLRFESIAAGVETADFETDASEAIDLTAEMTRLLLPILAELKEATATSRELDALKRTIAVEEERLEMAARPRTAPLN